MNAAELQLRTSRPRTRAEIESDLQAGCRVIGAMALNARSRQRPIDRHNLRSVLEGMRRLLAEPVGGGE